MWLWLCELLLLGIFIILTQIALVACRVICKMGESCRGQASIPCVGPLALSAVPCLKSRKTGSWWQSLETCSICVRSPGARTTRLSLPPTSCKLLVCKHLQQREHSHNASCYCWQGVCHRSAETPFTHSLCGYEYFPVWFQTWLSELAQLMIAFVLWHVPGMEAACRGLPMPCLVSCNLSTIQIITVCVGVVAWLVHLNVAGMSLDSIPASCVITGNFWRLWSTSCLSSCMRPTLVSKIWPARPFSKSAISANESLCKFRCSMLAASLAQRSTGFCLHQCQCSFVAVALWSSTDHVLQWRWVSYHCITSVCVWSRTAEIKSAYMKRS